MKKIISLMLLCLTVVLASCQKEEPTPESVPVAFSALAANGSDTETTTVLTITLDKAITGLAATDITLTAGVTGATKGTLTDKGKGVYELAVGGITKAGEVTVAVAKTGYTVAPASKTVAVKFYTAPSDIAVAFSNLTANGSDTETTSVLTLTFDQAIAGLAVADITLTAGETGTTKGALTDKGNGVYELAVSGITKAGEVTVAVAKAGYAVTPESKIVAVKYYVAPAKVGDFYYSDKTFSTALDAAKTVIGIVFWIDPADGKKGKIVSLDEATGKAWSTENVTTSATGDNDGAANTDKVLAFSSYTAEKYPAFAWCAAKHTSAITGINWYIPAKLELKDGIYANKATLNTSLNAASKTPLSNDYYWSSTEDLDYSAWFVNFDRGGANATNKYYGSSVRVVSAF